MSTMVSTVRRPVSAVRGRLRRRVAEEALERLRGGPRTRRQNARFAALLRDLGDLAVDLAPSGGWDDVQLTRAILDLHSVVARERASEDAAVAVSLGRRAWHAEPSDAWEALLAVGRRARWCVPEIAARVADELLAARPGDEAATGLAEAARRRIEQERAPEWRQRSRRRRRDGRVPLALDRLAGPASGQGHRAGDGVPSWTAPAWHHAPGAFAPAAVPALREAYFGDDRAERPFVTTLSSVLAHGASAGGDLAPLQDVLDTAASGLGPRARARTSAGGGPRTIGWSGLREYLAGRSVCLVANSADLIGRGLGARIDSYDVVVRFNSFALDAEHTGERTDVHATIHLHDFNWDVPVDLRLVFGAASDEWSANVARLLRPEAQRLVGDESLRWPRRTLLGDDLRARCPVPTTGFNVLLLLDYLDVSTRIDLFGFTFHSTEPFRRPDAMHLPVADVHSYEVERAWVAERAVSTGPGRISLR